MVVPTKKEEPRERRQSKLTMSSLAVDYMAILETQSITGETETMMETIATELAKIPDISIKSDDYGNVYVTKGELSKNEKYPAFVSHTDTVHKIRETYTVLRSKKGNLFAYSEDIDNDFKEVGIGGDDKCGIILCLELLHRLKKIKVAFFLDEESGCKGSAAGDLTFFDDCRYAIQIDRKDHGDIITKGNSTELCSDEFIECLETIGAKYKYKKCDGANTDVVELKKRGLGISVCNLSAGYYNPHSKQEFINENDLLNCLEFCIAISRIKTVYPHVLPPKKEYTTNSYTSGKYNRGGYKSESKYLPAKHCAICTVPMGSRDGKLCVKCIRDNLVLIIRDGNSYVYESTICDVAPPERVTDESEHYCNYCNIELRLISEIAKEACVNCSFCVFSDCNTELCTKDELLENLCRKHMVNRVKCEHPACDNPLILDSERQSGYCVVCYPSPSSELNQCMGYDCRKELVHDDEIENGICRGCKLEMFSHT